MPLTSIQPCPDNELISSATDSLMNTHKDLSGKVSESPSLFLRRIHLAKLLALYEVFKMVEDLPGSIVELGVFKGESLMVFAKLMEILNINDRSCKVIGFDNFRGFEKVHAKDGQPDSVSDKVVGGWSPADHYDDLKKLINIFDLDRMVGQKPRIELVEGDICESVPGYVDKNPGLRIRILNLDCDMYEPTLVGLKHLYHKVVPGGVVLLDEYAFEEFPGESAAVEEFFGASMPLIKKFPFYSNPGGYIIKPFAS